MKTLRTFAILSLVLSTSSPALATLHGKLIYQKTEVSGAYTRVMMPKFVADGGKEYFITALQGMSGGELCSRALNRPAEEFIAMGAASLYDTSDAMVSYNAIENTAELEDSSKFYATKEIHCMSKYAGVALADQVVEKGKLVKLVWPRFLFNGKEYVVETSNILDGNTFASYCRLFGFSDFESIDIIHDNASKRESIYLAPSIVPNETGYFELQYMYRSVDGAKKNPFLRSIVCKK